MKKYMLLLLLLSCISSSLVVGAEAEQKDDAKWIHARLSGTFDSFSAIFWAYIRSNFEDMKAQKADDLTDNTGDLFQKGDIQIEPHVIFYPGSQRLSLDYHTLLILSEPPASESKSDQEGNKYFSCLYNSSKDCGCIFEFNKDPILPEDFNRLRVVEEPFEDICRASGFLAGAGNERLLRFLINGKPRDSYSKY